MGRAGRGQACAARDRHGQTGERAANAESKPLVFALACARRHHALLLLAAVGGWSMFSGHLTKPALAAHLSIVVLPFANLSGDLAQDYFADGVTGELRLPSFRVSATVS